MRAVARIDLDAIASNLNVIGAAAGTAEVMAVVKADAYGHGAVPIARAARACEVPWLGVAYPSEALALRQSGDRGRILAWLWLPGDADALACVEAGVDLGVSSVEQLEFLAASASAPARIHLKVDTGLGRSGAAIDTWSALVTAAQAGPFEVVAAWSHFANGELAGDASVIEQTQLFLDVTDGLPVLRHLANSGALFANPDTRLDLVRTGIAMYGLNPGGDRPPVTPAMTLRSSVALTKRVPAGHGVSYGHTWRASTSTNLALIPVGYGDGIPRNATASVRIGDARYPIVGRVAMDQCVVHLGENASVRVGDPVEFFGAGEYTADEFASECGTIGYEIVARISARVRREYIG